MREQQGEAVFDLVERIRQTSIRFHRTEDEAARRELEALLNGLSRLEAIHIIRAYGFFSHLANIAEDQHHIRRIRAHASRPARARAHGLRPGARQSNRCLARPAGGFLHHGPNRTSPYRPPYRGSTQSTIDREMEVAELLAERDRAALTHEEGRAS